MPDGLESFGRRLARTGLPGKYVDRTVRELAEHRLDLKEEGLAAGLSEAAAEAFAKERLGDLDELAVRVTEQMGGISWWGRHRIVGFCMLPILSCFIWFALAIVAADLLTGLSAWTRHKDTLAEPDWVVLSLVLPVAYYGGMLALPSLFCVLAWRRFCGFPWAFAACGFLALHGLLNHVSWRLGPGGYITWGYTLPPTGWVGFLFPLATFAVFCLVVRRSEGLDPVRLRPT